MRQTRRSWLKGTGVALFGTAVAGCSGAFEDDESGSTPDTDGDDQSTATATETGSAGDEETATGPDPTDVAVVAEWNAIRTRLRDPVILGHGEEFAAGASVAADIFERFEKASGEHNAHETLEETNETYYAGFEEGLADLRGALEAEDLDGAHEAMHAADEHLRKAQGALAGSEAVKPLSMLVMGAHVADAALLASIGDFSDAAGEFTQIGTKFDEKGMGEMLAGADTEAAEAFTDAVDRAAAAAEDEDAAAVAEHAGAAFDAVTGGSYSLLPETVAGVAHLGAIQARGWDAAALASLGGPGTDFAHAATLATYRARVHDAAWLYERGHADAAKTRVENVFAHFEGARAHEALEDASEDAYHRFEDDGLGALTTAIDEDDADGVAETVETTDAALVEGVEALGSGVEPALLEAGYFKARVEDALERYRLGEGAVAAETVRGLFETFEANEADFHETLEETDESLYETFEEDHLDGLVTAFEESDATRAVIDGDRPALERAIAELGYRVVSETWVREVGDRPLELVRTVEERLGSVEDGVRFGAVVPADPVSVAVESLPAELLAEAQGIDLEAAYDAVADNVVAFETSEGATKASGRTVLADAADASAVVDDLAAVLRGRYEEVRREDGAVVATRTAFDPERARELGVSEGPAFGELSAGRAVEVDGERVAPADVHQETTRRFPTGG